MKASLREDYFRGKVKLSTIIGKYFRANLSRGKKYLENIHIQTAAIMMGVSRTTLLMELASFIGLMG